MGQSHLANYLVVRNSLIGASRPPVHTRKPPISSSLGRVLQPRLSDLPFTRSPYGKGSSTHLSLCRLTPGILLTRRANSGDFSGIVVHSSWVFCAMRDGARHSSLVYPSLPPVGSSERPSLASTPFDDHAGPPLQSLHHSTTRASRFIPAKAGATTSPSIRPIYTSATSAIRSPSVAPIYTQHFPPTLYEW